ncbi:MAG: carbohydrate ABC transporter permease [Clostridia bacterium]|nr:carbohydrate ABC transporter permease [Clostridia bacterium]
MIAGKKLNIALHILFTIMAVCCLFPILLTLSISLSSNKSLVEFGYNIIPKEFSIEAYKFIFMDSTKILRAYGITIFNAVVGGTLSVLVIAHLAYPLSRADFKLRKPLTFFILFTMLFNGGSVATYMSITTIYHLQNNIWVMILPCMMNVWYVVVMRTFFKTGVPNAIIESGKLDGASELRILWQLVFPISLPGIATIALFQVLLYWNEWNLPLLYIVEPKLYNLQFLLQQMMQNIQMLNENPEFAQQAAAGMAEIPTEGARMALCFVAMGPILVTYPFFQKYFIQGLTVGSVKE